MIQILIVEVSQLLCENQKDQFQIHMKTPNAVS